MESSLLARILYITCFFASAINAFLPIKLSHFAIECGRTPPRLFAGNFFDEIEGFPEESESREVLSDEALEAAAGEWDPSIPQFNRITLTGRIGNDPDPRYFDDGKVVPKEGHGQFVARAPRPAVNRALSQWKDLTAPRPVTRSGMSATGV